jgi:hypothetical protein
MYCLCLPEATGHFCERDLTCYRNGTLLENGTCECISPYSGRLCKQGNTEDFL